MHTPRKRHGDHSPGKASGFHGTEEGRDDGEDITSDTDLATPSANSPAAVEHSVDDRVEFLGSLSREKEYEAMLLAMKDIVSYGF